MVDKELIEIWRNMMKPAISLWLLNTNYEEMGEQDKEEFERDFDEILDLALIGLKHKAQLSQEGTTKDATSATSSTADTISQQTAVELVMKYCPDDDGAVQCDGDIRELLDELENLPLTQSEPKWIPCGETVDIPDHEVMACDRCGEFIIGYLDYKDEQWICESDSCLMYDPVAWCELPEPYKEGGMKSEGSEDA